MPKKRKLALPMGTDYDGCDNIRHRHAQNHHLFLQQTATRNSATAFPPPPPQLPSVCLRTNICLGSLLPPQRVHAQGSVPCPSLGPSGFVRRALAMRVCLYLPPLLQHAATIKKIKGPSYKSHGLQNVNLNALVRTSCPMDGATNGARAATTSGARVPMTPGAKAATASGAACPWEAGSLKLAISEGCCTFRVAQDT